MSEIALGSEVECKVTGFRGIAVSRVQYLNGCIHYGVKPKAGPDGKMIDAEYIDVDQLQVVGGGVQIVPKTTGGPQRDAPRTR